jgi:hypothetical protein
MTRDGRWSSSNVFAVYVGFYCDWLSIEKYAFSILRLITAISGTCVENWHKNPQAEFCEVFD